ncbi:excinuclease ABC subunit A [Sarcina sp. DSM 11001]|uniref:excinuclease ABC subunit UvrA n=1 Tax=Sarcina sp. DSM 11001 TaxID=1798184 RepID=UPI00088FB717|nr:excinuclease ABC subunit UvrA [Sarcina sp. DSM 11001]SDL39831.1 excinuclease ABC subunit A [Sarcina sp. DSM 11001]
MEQPKKIQVRGARVHNLKNIDVDIPLHGITGIAGVSGSGKSSLALGVLYAEGSRRYLESLSTYTRRRMTQASRADVDEVLYVPASLALHQRPGVPGIRSTFGTGTELLNSLRLMFSRLSSHRCPNGHYVEPGFQVALMQEIVCPECGERFYGPGAEELAFNSQGACKCCGGTGTVRTVDRSTLIPDESLTIDDGAVAPWNSLMWSLMTDVCRAMGVRTDIPFRDLTNEEKEIVYDGPMVKKHIFYRPKKADTATAGEMDFTYYSATATVLNALNKVKDEKGMKRVEKFLKEEICPDCRGTRLSEAARAPRLMGISLDQACGMTLKDSVEWVKKVPASLPEKMRPMAKNICESYLETAARLLDLGLGYLTLDRASSTLSTGERQRMQLARAVRNRTTGVLYVLDEPSIGLHPANIVGLNGVMHDLVRDGNSVLLVDHDTQILKESDWLIEMGPEAGAKGGMVIAEGTIEEIEKNEASVIGRYLSGKQKPARPKAEKNIFSNGGIRMKTEWIHTVRPLTVRIPRTGLTVITGVSGSGKTTLILESLVPALDALCSGKKMPGHIRSIEAEGIRHVKLIDAAPIGINVRSTVATYANVHDELRKIFARTKSAKEYGYKAGDFSYNTGSLRCPVCDGTGQISLDVQFLPDVNIPCPECRGSRYAKEAKKIRYTNKSGEECSLPELMDMDVNSALGFCREMKTVRPRLEILRDLGLGYLTLGEETPGLSGGEAQRLKLASEMGRQQDDSVFVFDEPTIGLHPKDVETLLKVFQTLIDHGATVIVIEHDLDVIRAADYIIDMGPEGGEDGGRIVACGTPDEIRQCSESITGKFL